MIHKEGCTCPAPQTIPDMSTPASQQDTQFIDTQVHELLLRQQHIRVLLESCPDEADIEYTANKGMSTPPRCFSILLLVVY
jgi:hypothetical protein